MPPSEDVTSDQLPAPARALLDAVVAISTDLNLHRVLRRLVESACELTGARYGALGVLRPPGEPGPRRLSEFIVHGMDVDTQRLIGDRPHGHGILGLLVEDPRPLRLDDLGSHVGSYGFPPGHPPMRTFLGVPVTVQGRVFGNLYLTEKADGARFTALDEELVTALASAAGFVVANARAYGLSERRRRWLEATARLGQALQPPVEEDEALEQVANIMRAVSGAVAVAVLRPVAGGHPEVLARDGARAALVGPILQQAGDLLHDLDEPTGVLPVEVRGEELSLVLLPLRSHLTPSAVILTAFAAGSRIDDEERQLLTTYADHAALSLDRVKAIEDREELAVVSERDRIARDLHDVVIQRLFATGLQLQSIGMRLPEGEELGDALDKAVDDLDLTVKDIRGTIFQLQSRHGTSLRGDVRKIAKEYVPVLGFTPDVHTRGPVDTVVPEPVQKELLAVLREAVSNVARHARARSASIEVKADVAALTLRVTDDGRGLPADSPASGGLRNARRRAEALGGSLEVSHAPPGGTSFVWCVPLP